MATWIGRSRVEAVLYARGMPLRLGTATLRWQLRQTYGALLNDCITEDGMRSCFIAALGRSDNPKLAPTR